MDPNLWSTLALWSLGVLAFVWGLVRFTIKAPRPRAILILTGFSLTLVPLGKALRPAPFEQRQTERAAWVAEANPVQTSQTLSAGSIRQTETALQTEEAPTAKNFEWKGFVGPVWVAGAIVGWIGLVIAIFRMNRFAKLGNPQTPMIAGFPRPKLLLPAHWPGDLTTAEAEAALAHEEAHLRHRHLLGRVLIEALRRGMWWIPFAHWLARIYDQSLEEIADAEALKRHDPATLASALLKAAAADSTPHLCTGAAKTGNDLEERIRKIMKRNSPERLSVALIFSILAMVAAFAVAPRAPLSFEPVDFGLKPHAKWTYAIRYAGQPDMNRLERGVGQILREKGQTVYEIRTNYYDPARTPRANSRDLGYEYVALRDDGLFALHNSRMQGPGHDSSNPDPLFKAPFKVGQTWKWHAPFRGQTMSGPDGKSPDLELLANDCVAKVEAEENVTVPAGTFHCFRVRVAKSSKAGDSSVEVHWLDLNAGLIKTTISWKGKLAQTWTLEKFEPGTKAKS